MDRGAHQAGGNARPHRHRRRQGGALPQRADGLHTSPRQREGCPAGGCCRPGGENYFSHIIIDECHRSAWGKWSEVLRRNPDAVQIGLTATPRKIKLPENVDPADLADDERLLADNIRHFGEPVYEYDLATLLSAARAELAAIQALPAAALRRVFS